MADRPQSPKYQFGPWTGWWAITAKYAGILGVVAGVLTVFLLLAMQLIP